mmetsp:Transcript_51708/g.134942  ORF Transcript_51708/g.134942 Transcript_51708/m.134942 type:complete len:211 (+) Transcript_51708:565-1197(+)
MLADHPALRSYDYFWRIDSDCFLIGRVWTDPFHFLDRQNFKYGFVSTSREPDQLTEGLWDLVERFRLIQGIPPSSWMRFRWSGFVFSTSSVVSRLDFWRLPQVRQYLQQVDRAGGIYEHRWSDAAIQTLAASLYLAPQELVQLIFIPTWHRNHALLPQPWVDDESRLPDGFPRRRAGGAREGGRSGDSAAARQSSGPGAPKSPSRTRNEL